MADAYDDAVALLQERVEAGDAKAAEALARLLKPESTERVHPFAEYSTDRVLDEIFDVLGCLVKAGELTIGAIKRRTKAIERG